MKQAVCALIHSNGKIIAVSRKDNPNDFGLPGGKVDEGETLEEAISREVFEELGKQISAMKFLFKEIEGEYLTTTFLCIFGEKQFPINPKETGVIKEVDWEVLTNKETSSFAEYNTKLMNYYFIFNEEENYE